MKFKAVLTDQICMKDFYNIIATFAKVSKYATLNLHKTGLSLSNVGAASITSHPLLWATVDKSDLFAQFSVNGLDEQKDEIWLTFCPEHLATSLNTLKNFVKSITIKLSKKQFVCLFIDIEMAPPNSNNFRRMLHDVPVTLIPPNEWKEHKLPSPCHFQISIQMPTLKSLRTLCDKMKNLSPTLTVCCGSNGTVSFIVETESAMVVNHYDYLVLEDSTKGVANNEKELEEISCQIDTKQLSQIFNSIQFQNIGMVGNMLQDELFNLKIKIRENVVMNYNIGAVDTS